MKNGQSCLACGFLPLHTNTCFERDGELMEALIHPEEILLPFAGIEGVITRQ